MVSCLWRRGASTSSDLSYPPSSSSVTSRTRARISVAVGEVLLGFFSPAGSLICYSAEMSATSEANKELVGDAFASMVRRTLLLLVPHLFWYTCILHPLALCFLVFSPKVPLYRTKHFSVLPGTENNDMKFVFVSFNSVNTSYMFFSLNTYRQFY